MVEPAATARTTRKLLRVAYRRSWSTTHRRTLAPSCHAIQRKCSICTAQLASGGVLAETQTQTHTCSRQLVRCYHPRSPCAALARLLVETAVTAPSKEFGREVKVFGTFYQTCPRSVIAPHTPDLRPALISYNGFLDIGRCRELEMHPAVQPLGLSMIFKLDQRLHLDDASRLLTLKLDKSVRRVVIIVLHNGGIHATRWDG